MTTSEGRMFSTPNDVVSLVGKWRAAFNPNMEMNIIKSTDQSLVNTLTGGHSLTNQAPLEEVAPSKTSSAIRSASGAVGEFVKGSLPIMGASYAVDKLMPNAPDVVKIPMVSIGGASGIKLLSQMAGTPVAVSGLVAPIAGSLVALKGADIAANKILPENMEHHARESLRGAFDGAAGGLGFVGTQSAISAASTSTAAGTAEIEMVAMGETAAAEAAAAEVAAAETAAATTLEAGTELTGLAAFESTAITATELTGEAALAEGGLNPVADGAFMVALTGTAIGGVTGLITSLFDHNTSQNTPSPAPTTPIISEDELQRIRNAPSKPHGWHMLNNIEQDAEFQRLMDEGTIEQVNARVEKVIMQRAFNHVNESGVVNGTDTYPVFNTDGTWSQEAWNQQRVNENQDAVQEYKMMQMRPIVAAHDAAVAAKTAAIQENLRYGEIYTKETEQMDSLQHPVNNIYNINPVLSPTLEDDQNIPLGRS